MRIYSLSEVPLSDVVRLLKAIDRIHRRYQVIDTVFVLLKQGYRLPPDSRPGVDRLSEIFKRADAGLSLPQFKAAEFHSPGFWEILGSLSPLKFITDCLHFWHERNKDIEYRGEAEAAKLWLENESKTNEILTKRLELLRAAGASDEEIHRHFIRPVAASISILYQLSSRGMVSASKTVVSLPIPDGEV